MEHDVCLLRVTSKTFSILVMSFPSNLLLYDDTEVLFSSNGSTVDWDLYKKKKIPNEIAAYKSSATIRLWLVADKLGIQRIKKFQEMRKRNEYVLFFVKIYKVV
jgi:hypothetical protein